MRKQSNKRWWWTVIAALACCQALYACDDPPANTEQETRDPFDRLDLGPSDASDTSDIEDPPIPLDALYVDFDAGTLQIGKSPLTWRFLTGGVVRSEPRSPEGASVIEVEWVATRPLDGFDDPTPPIDQPRQAWAIASFEQPIPRGPLTATLQDLSNPDAGHLKLTITPDGIGLRLDIEPVANPGYEVRRLAFNWSDAAGPLLGTGMRPDALDSRGRQRALFLRDDDFSASGSNDALLPAPWILNPLGYGVFIDSDHPGVFDLGAERQGVLSARFDTHTLSVQFWLSGDPLRILERYTAATGRPPKPPLWALAPQWWRTKTSASEILSDAQTLRNYDIPAGGLWIDDPWLSAYNNLEFNPTQFPDPAQTLSALKALGFDTVLWTNPFLNISDDSQLGPGWTSAAALFEEAARQGYLVTDPDKQPIELSWGNDHTGGLIDFTNPDAVAWWGERAATLMALGVSGLRLDTSSPLLHTDLWLWAEDYRFANGESFQTMHRRYANATYEAAQTVLGPEGLLLGGEGAFGAQTHLHGVWSPRLRAGFGPHTDATVGGLEAALAAGLSMSMSGYPFFAPEIGGFAGDPPTDEALLRWAALGVCSPIMQIGGDTIETLPWETNTETVERLRTLSKLRIQLTRYLEVQTEAAVTSGTPIMRPIPISFPDYGEALGIFNQFMFGPDLLVAPVLDEDAVEWDVFIPPGHWRNWYTSAFYTGPTWVRVAAPLDQIPLFAREGAAIPLRLDSVDTLRPNPNPPEGVITPTQADSTLYLKVFGFAPSTLDLPDGAKVVIDFRAGANQTDVTFTAGSLTSSVVFEFMGPEAKEAYCQSGEDPLASDPTLAIRITQPDDTFAYRLIPQGTIVRLPTDGTCRLQWFKGL